jgi:MFS family permease
VYGFRWEQWSALAGALFVAVALAVCSNNDDGPQELASWLADSGNRTQQFVSWFLYIASALAFLSFLGTLRDMLVRAEGAPRTLSSLVFGPGLVFVGLYVAGVTLFAAPATLADEKHFKLDPNTAEMFYDAGYLMLVTGVMVAAIMASTAALRTGVLPARLGWVGLVIAVVMLFAVVFIPILVFVGWALVVSLVMVVAAWRVRGATPPPAPATSTEVG